MNIQNIADKIAYYTFPSCVRTSGKGLYDIARRNEKEKQCQDLLASTLRITAAVAAFFAMIAMNVIIPQPLGLFASGITLLGLPFLDTEIGALVLSGIFASTGILLTATIVACVAEGIFLGVPFLLGGAVIYFGLAWGFSRLPKDLPEDAQEGLPKGFFAARIDATINDWGSRLYTIIPA